MHWWRCVHLFWLAVAMAAGRVLVFDMAVSIAMASADYGMGSSNCYCFSWRCPRFQHPMWQWLLLLLAEVSLLASEATNNYNPSYLLSDLIFNTVQKYIVWTHHWSIKIIVMTFMCLFILLHCKFLFLCISRAFPPDFMSWARVQRATYGHWRFGGRKRRKGAIAKVMRPAACHCLRGHGRFLAAKWPLGSSRIPNES